MMAQVELNFLPLCSLFSHYVCTYACSMERERENVMISVQFVSHI